MVSERRNWEQIKEHYEIESKLAEELRNSPAKTRRSLYRALYDELYRRVPHHPQLARRSDKGRLSKRVKQQMGVLKPFLETNSIFLETGSGDCSLARAVAKRVKKVFALEVSREISGSLTHPPNFQLIHYDQAIPLRESSITVAYSTHLIEHLHPDDALWLFQETYRVLVPGGLCICHTPNRLFGPHDVSKYFGDVATGFHLKEYTATELLELYRKVGFSQLKTRFWGHYLSILYPVRIWERLLGLFPPRFRKQLPYDRLESVIVVGLK